LNLFVVFWANSVVTQIIVERTKHLAGCLDALGRVSIFDRIPGRSMVVSRHLKKPSVATHKKAAPTP
jgi:hypothetical protein